MKVATTFMCGGLVECAFNIKPIFSYGIILMLMRLHVFVAIYVSYIFLSVFPHEILHSSGLLGMISTLNFLLLSPLSSFLSFCLCLSLSPVSTPLMDGQIMYIQSSSAPDAVKRCDKSPGGGTEQSGAERRDGVTKRTRHLGNREGRKKQKT